jgi:hypothetical protein
VTPPAFPKPSKSPRLGLRTSLRYEVVDGAYKRYPDGREICLPNAKGKAEYKARTEAMRLRQHNICSRGYHLIVNPTFDHSTRSRGMAGARRDDRIKDENGNEINSCSCFTCNGAAGSRKL